ncbi:MAG: flagellar motor switch protein FliM, partial [Pseudomonadota bacterium]
LEAVLEYDLGEEKQLHGGHDNAGALVPKDGEEAGAEEEAGEDLADDWAAMLEAEEGDGDANAASAEGGEEDSDAEERSLNQDEIDSLLGFNFNNEANEPKSGIYAMLDKSLKSYQRLPLLEVVFDRFTRMLSSSLRNYTSDNVDVDINSIVSLRFEDYINSVPMPVLLTVFKAVEWENYGLITFDGSLVYSMIEILFGGRKLTKPIRIDGRPYTTIERNIIKQLTEIILADMGSAFDPLSPATLKFDRLENNPRFASIVRPSDPVILLQLRIDIEERGGNIEILIPYATIEPIREILSQVFMGEKFGKDKIWENHFEREVNKSKLDVIAVIDPKTVMLKDVMNLQIGNTIILDNSPDDEVTLKCKGIDIAYGTIGKVENSMAISITRASNEILDNIYS